MSSGGAESRPRCPNGECPAPHVVRNGHLNGRQRYHCKGCGAWFGETHGTPLYRLKTSAAEIGRSLLVVMRRGSLRAAEEVTGHKYETIGHWVHLAGRHAAEIEEALVRDLHLSVVEIDEFWSFVKKRTRTGPRMTRRMSGIAGAA
jgi:transposase-like protein